MQRIFAVLSPSFAIGKTSPELVQIRVLRQEEVEEAHVVIDELGEAAEQSDNSEERKKNRKKGVGKTDKRPKKKDKKKRRKGSDSASDSGSGSDSDDAIAGMGPTRFASSEKQVKAAVRRGQKAKGSELEDFVA